jgi:hypothetical protein
MDFIVLTLCFLIFALNAKEGSNYYEVESLDQLYGKVNKQTPAPTTPNTPAPPKPRKQQTTKTPNAEFLSFDQVTGMTIKEDAFNELTKDR